MKLSVVLAFAGMISVSANNSYSQHPEFTFNNHHTTLHDLITTIESSSEYVFLYSDDLKGMDQKIRIDGELMTVNVILDKVTEDIKINYEVIDNQIVLSQVPATPPSSITKFRFLSPFENGTGSVRGNITDEKGQAMVGATIVVLGTTIGTISDVNGNYQILGIPAGKQILKISFVGYNVETREINLERGGIIILDVKLSISSTEISEVVAYGQAKGQLAAINQQLNASGISNVISAEKLQELPDVNIAEAVGRLPGLMVERNRGEGQKIIIRGLAPKYNTISIGGTMVPSTSPDDRSTDLNMISPDIVGGVEVQKANTADKEADGLGGTVNLTLKEAQSGFKLSGGILSGYSGHTKSLSNYRANIYMSNRFFKDKLGMMITGNADIAERNSDRLNVNYAVQGTPNYDAGETYIKPWVTTMSAQANIEERTRSGGSFLLDWKLSPSHTIKSSNFIGYLDRDIYDREKRYDLGLNYLSINQFQYRIKQLILSNSVEGKHFVLGSVIDWGGSHSVSKNERPDGKSYQFRSLSAFNDLAQGKSYDIEPPELIPMPENVNDFLERYYFYNGQNTTYDSEEIEKSLFINLQTPFRFGGFINGFVKAGTKYREKDRDRSNVRYERRLDGAANVAAFLEKYPDYVLTTEGLTDKLSILNFLDEDYKPEDFLNNQYEYINVDQVLDRGLMSGIYNDYLKDYYYFIPGGAQNNYKTNESVLSFYLMSELNFGKYVTFIPGIRYEKSDIEYLAYIAYAIPSDLSVPTDVEFTDTTATNSYSNLLPQIHLRIKPTDWFDIRLAYTNTLSRPDYNQLAPKKIININDQSVTLGNTSLNPALSRNYDAIFTFYKPKYGLFTLGAFYKDIEGFIWSRQALIVSNTDTDPDILKLPESTLGYTAVYPKNNPNRSSIMGFELDLQSNMNFLPIKGFVFNLNLTIMDSETKYSQTLVIRKANPDFGVIPGAPRVIFVNHDTAYVERMLSQPSYLANIGLGYDNRKIGLSARLSFNFQDDILIMEQRRPDGADREGSLEFHRWDFQFIQRITKRISLNGNISNIFNYPDRSVRLLTGYIRNLEYYGYSAQLGLKFNLF